MHETSLTSALREALLFLAAAAVFVPLFRRLSVSPVIGFMLVGALLGPSALGAMAGQWPLLQYVSVPDVANLAGLGELGVVFLLFMIGLELSFERLKLMRRLVFGLGGLQFALSFVVLGAAALWAGLDVRAAAIVGAALAMSSTAIVLPLLSESKRLRSPTGRAVFAVLLFQDLMVAPLLFVEGLLGKQGGPATALDIFIGFAPALIGLALIVGLGRLVLRPLFDLVAQASSMEFFVAACFLVVLGTSAVAAASGLSMGLGALIAGLLLAETEYRREVEVTIEPFKGLLLGLFFFSVGAGLRLSEITAAPLRLLALTAAMLALKAVVAFAAARVFNLDRPTSRESALLIAPGGEFALIMIGAAVASGIVPEAAGATLLVVVTLSMVATPPLAALARRIGRKAVDPATLEAELGPPEVGGEGHVIVVGYGRVGQIVGDMLRRHEIPFIAVDGEARLVRETRKEGTTIYWGDATRPEFLRRCGVARARALVVTLNAPRAAEEIVAAGRAERADITIVARARDAEHATHLYALGATDAVPETIEASLQLSEAMLVDIGVPMGYVIASIHEKRDEFRKQLQPADRAAPARAIKMSTRLKGVRKT